MATKSSTTKQDAALAKLFGTAKTPTPRTIVAKNVAAPTPPPATVKPAGTANTTLPRSPSSSTGGIVGNNTATDGSEWMAAHPGEIYNRPSTEPYRPPGAPTTQGTGPHASATARRHANRRARFMRSSTPEQSAWHKGVFEAMKAARDAYLVAHPRPTTT